MDLNHPITNPRYNKLDYLRNGVFASTRVQFSLLLEEGCSLQQLGTIAAQLQAAIARAYTVAAGGVASDFAGPIQEPPQWNTFPDASGDEPPPADDNPFSPS
jgi:hypothetical protein